MTIQDAIAQADDLRPNTYSMGQKVGWLKRCETMLRRTVLLEPGEPEWPEDHMQVELTVPEPWCGLYVRWLEAQSHYANGEYDRYNDAITAFNADMAGYRNEVARSTTAKESRFRF